MHISRAKTDIIYIFIVPGCAPQKYRVSECLCSIQVTASPNNGDATDINYPTV
jgi:hypothetical protein